MLPENWSLVPIQGRYVLRDGTPATGYITFESRQVVMVDGVQVVPKTLVAHLTKDGEIPAGFALPSTDDPALSVGGWAYKVTESWQGGRNPFSIFVPHNAAQIDLPDAAPVVPPPELADTRGPRGYAGTMAVESVETVEAGIPASVENVGDASDARLVFRIPKGDTGDVTPEALAARDAAVGAASAAAGSAAAAGGAVQVLRDDLADPTGGAGLVAVGVGVTVADLVGARQGEPGFETGIDIVTNPAINSIAAGGRSNTIAGGGRATFPNAMTNSTSDASELASYRTISGGYDNTIRGSVASTISGGAHHRINAADNLATDHNTISGGSYGIIARGRYSTIGGGTQNSIDGDNATIGGGNGNNISGNFDNASIAGGYQNVASNQHATVVGGYLCVASGDGSVAGGKVNTASGAKSVAIGGEGNTSGGISGALVGGEGNVANATASRSDYAGMIGGFQNTIGASAQARFSGMLSGRQNSVNSEYGATIGGRECVVPAGCEGAVAMGYGAKASAASEMVQAGGYFSAVGDAQTSVIVARRVTTDAVPAELRLNSTLGARILMPTDTTWAFSIFVVARRTDVDNESAAYKIEGCIDRQASLVAFVGTPIVAVIGEDNAAWNVSVFPDTTNSALQINVTGEAGKTIRWVARVTLTEVSG